MQEKHFCITLIGLSFLVHRVWGVGGGGAVNKVLYGEAPPRGPISYPFIFHFPAFPIDDNRSQSIPIDIN